MTRAVAVSMLVVAASCAVCEGSSWAITIANSDFEDRTTFTDFMPGVDSGTTRTRNRDAPPGWTMLGWGGDWRAGTSVDNAGNMHGILPYYGLNVAYLDFGFLYQDPAGAVLEANRSYTLSAAIGRRYDVNAAAYTISVWAGTPSAGYQRIAYYAGSTGDQQPGEWLMRSVRFQTFEGNLNEHVGKQLRVALSRTALSGGQVNFDSVALEFAHTPEPSAVALFGTIALALATARWRAANARGQRLPVDKCKTLKDRHSTDGNGMFQEVAGKECG